MLTVRRIYILLVSAISLQAITWAFIYLMRGVIPPGASEPVLTLASQIALIVVAVPFYLIHWLWAQRLARRDETERADSLRRFYLYAMLAAFLGPLIYQVFELLMTLLGIPLGVTRNSFSPYFSPPSPTEIIVDNIIAIVVLVLLAVYHYGIIYQDERAEVQAEGSMTVRRVFVLSFAGAGLLMFTIGAVQLLRWVMFQFGASASIGAGRIGLAEELARVLVGLPVWLVFWLFAQMLFHRANEGVGDPVGERASAFRKFYLYLVVFSGATSAVTNATFILAGFLRAGLDLRTEGDIREPLSVILVAGVVWIYHWLVLRDDAKLVAFAPAQAAIRRIYLYLVAAVGLGAFLGGLAGDVSVMIQAVGNALFGSSLKEQLAWSTAALIAGFPVWLIPWRQAQNGATAKGEAGALERRAVTRKIYLYFYLFVASMTVLGSMVYIVFRFVSIALGERFGGSLLVDLGHALAFTAIAVGVLVYHGFALRGDGEAARVEKAERLAMMRVAIVSDAQDSFAQNLLNALQREVPELPTQIVVGISEREQVAKQLNEAGLIIASANYALASSLPNGFASALNASPARKLFVPARMEKIDWVGVAMENPEKQMRETVRAVKQILEGEEVKPARGFGASGGVTLLIALFGLCILIQIVQFIFSMMFSRF